MAGSKEISAEKKSVRTKKAKRIITLFVIFAVLAGAVLGYYFFFYKNNQATSLMSENEQQVIFEQIGQLMNDFLEAVKWESINDTGDISPYVLPEAKDEIQAKLFPDGWTDLPGAIIETPVLGDKDNATVAIVFPLQSIDSEKFMTNVYNVVRQDNRWSVSGIKSEVIKDHGITIWPVSQETTDLGEIQKNIRDHRDSWRLDPLETVQESAEANGFSPDDNFELISDIYTWVPLVGTYRAVVKATHEDQIFYFLLTQPLRKGYWGVWSIESITRDPPII